jgi:hypothetical protein
MTGIKRIVVLACFVALVIAVLFGCSMVPWDFEKNGWYIMLNVDNPEAAKTIDVIEHEVTALHIEIFDPEGELLDAVDWDAAAPWERPYVINVNQEGDYGIEVTHISESNSEVVEATEVDGFNIQSMVITVINITPGVVGTIDVQQQGGEPGPEGGTLTVHLTEMDVPDDTTVAIGLYGHGVDPMVDPLGFLACGGDPVFSGESHSALITSSGDAVWTGTQDELYDLYIWLDMNENLDEYMYAEDGIDLVYYTFPDPIVVQIDGPTHVYAQGADFMYAPPMEMP